MTGISSQKALASNVNKLLPPSLACFFSSSSDPACGENRGSSEVELVTGTRKINLHCQLIDLHDQNASYRGQVLLLSDMTQLKALEAEMRENERLAAVVRMAAGGAHEVRNPLSSIKGLALLLKDTFSSKSAEFETTGLLIQEVERMNRTISELLSFARPASLDIKEVDLKELLSEILHLFSVDATSEQITIQLHCEDSLPPVPADRDRLNQVCINILLNSIQSIRGGGQITILVQPSSDGTAVELQCRDTGVGIESDQLSQVFFPYYTTKTGGTGIGLAISQKIIVDHGGTIRIESSAGRGTTVFITLPLSC